ncbi:MAG: glycosyltransferase family 2 protein [Prevotellaceae bacterium]|jgi:GT2 family glycosyltransferase|nr:glycosyltransferase family 2 protein [Prevotellaceae bacterium]
MKLSVVIVNYNVKEYLEQCLCSVQQAIRAIDAEVMVFDNASTDGSRTYIPDHFPWITYIYSEENLGFARANNRAVAHATGEYVLLLNPDTLVPETTIANVLAFMEAHPGAGIAGVKMTDGRGRFLPESKRGVPTLTATFGKLSGLYKLVPKTWKLAGYYRNDVDTEQIHPVEVLAGAFMMVRRALYLSVGGLDERYFMYGEDVQFSMRVGADYTNYYLPYPIVHYKGKSTRHNAAQVRTFCQAMELYYVATRRPGFTTVVVRACIRLYMHLRLFTLLFRSKP